MMPDEKKELERLDPESEACFASLKARISSELGTRIASGDDPSTPQGREVLSGLIADVLLDSYVVRERKTPRYQWKRK
jgi:hypothetical protein